MEAAFIVIDDSDLDCFITKKIIGQIAQQLNIVVFKNAAPALEMLRDKKKQLNYPLTIIFLDLYMPLMDGFKFLEEFEQLSADIQNSYNINVLSSTKNQIEIYRLKNFKTVNSFIEKPMTKEKLLDLLSKLKIKL